MEKIIQVAEEEGEKIHELPLEEGDGSLLYSTLVKHFPKAKGLRYYTEIDTIRGVKLSQGKFYPPHVKWGSTVYYCVFLQDLEDESLALSKSEFSLDFTTVSEEDVEENKGRESIIPDGNRRNADILPPSIRIENNSDDANIPQFTNMDQQSVNFANFQSTSPKNKIPKYRQLTNKRSHRCDICGNCFTQQSHMQRHRRIHTGEKPFSCEACGEKFSRSDKLKLHTAKCHAIAQLVNANTCDNEIREKREKPKILDEAYEWGTLPPISRAKQLTVKFKKNTPADVDTSNGDYYSVVNMAEVKMEDCDDQQKYFTCQFCSKIFSKKNQLQRHARTHTGERPFSCIICHKSFTRIDALKRHKASVGHRKQKSPDDNIFQGVYPDSDSNCQEGLVNAYEPKIEMETSNGDIDDRFHPKVEIEEDDETEIMDDEEEEYDEETSCDVASFAQVTYANLEQPRGEEPVVNSELIENKAGKENYCTLCQHSFTNKFNFTRHMKSHDKINKSFKCDYCHYLFRRQSHLTRHILIHTGEKPFQCTQCEEKFSRSDKLKLHISRVHGDPGVLQYPPTVLFVTGEQS